LHNGILNGSNKGISADAKNFNIPYANGKSALTEEGNHFTARELEVFLVQQA
jgi:hypothetical protein